LKFYRGKKGVLGCQKADRYQREATKTSRSSDQVTAFVASFLANHFPCFFQDALVRSKSFLEGPLPVFSPLTRKNPTPLAGWLTAGVILFISLGFIYGFFHHHQDFSSHPDCPLCTLAGQAPVITCPANGPSLEQTPQPLIPATIGRPVDPSFLTQTNPRAPPA